MEDIRKKRSLRQAGYPKFSLQTTWDLGRDAGIQAQLRPQNQFAF